MPKWIKDAEIRDALLKGLSALLLLTITTLTGLIYESIHRLESRTTDHGLSHTIQGGTNDRLKALEVWVEITKEK